MITAIGDVMREAYKRGWITTRDGNISLRRKGSDLIYITPSGWRKTIIHPEHMVKVKLTPAGVNLKGDVKPSGELHMHSMIQRYRKRTTAVVHLHLTYTVAAMYAGIDLQDLAQDFPELGRYTRVAPSVPVIPRTSDRHILSIGWERKAPRLSATVRHCWASEPRCVCRSQQSMGCL